MDLQAVNVDGVAVVAVNGRLDTRTAPDLAREIEKPLAGAAPRLVLDLSQTEYISSAGLRVFLQTAKAIDAAGGRFALCGANPRVLEILDVSGFGAILTICASRAEALAEVAA